jgi:hypothetical protein
MRISTFVAAFCPVLLSSSLALAQAATETPDVREHDGFYLRLGLGLGYAIGTSKPDEGSADADVTGIGIPSELAIGGTIAPGMVIGGGAYNIFLPSPTYKNESVDVDGGATQLGSLGPFIDYYLDPKGGIHFGGALLFASAAVAETDVAPKASGFGFGGALMGGYEVFVGDQWSIGVIGRLAYYSVKLTADLPGDPKSTLSVFTPAVLFGATYH